MNNEQFNEWYHLNPIAKTKREIHLESLLTMALPYVEREELSTKTSAFTRHLMAEIYDQVGKGN